MGNPNQTAGAERLSALMREQGLSQGELERRLGVAPGVVNHWLSGRRRPGLHTALQIERLLGLAPSVWETPEEQAKAVSYRMGDGTEDTDAAVGAA